MAKNRNEVVLPASDLGTDPLSQVLQQLPDSKPETSIGTQTLSSPSNFRNTSQTDISGLNQEQLNKFYLSPNQGDDSRLMNEIKADDQSIWNSAAKGIGKFAFKTGTSVLGGTVGTVYGGLSAIANGDFSKFYDNDVNKWLDEKNKWIDTALPIYENQEAQKNEWYNKMIPFTNGSAKFWFDDVAGGLSFTAGAVITEALTAGAATSSIALKTGELVNKALNLDKALSATTKATKILKGINNIENIKDAATFTRQLITGAGYESGVEARQAKEEILTNLKQKYKETNGVDLDESSPEYAQMVSTANKAANTVFAANMAILNIGNAIALPKTFGKLSSTFDKFTSKLSSPIADVSKLSEKVLERTAENLGKTVDEIKNLDFVSKWNTYNKLTKGIISTGKALESPIAEGLWEEGVQGTVSEAAKLYVAKKYDTNSQSALKDLTDSFGEAFTKTYGTSEGFKEIAIGMIIGAMGLPHIGTKEDGTKSLGWEGGIYGGVTGNTVEREETQNIVDLMNSNKALNSTKAMWQAANRNAADSNTKPETFFEAKNKENEDFFNYAYSRYKGGFISSISDEISKNVEKMDTAAFAETFGYTNLTDAELNNRKKEVVKKTQEKANSIKQAIELAEKINKTGDEDITEGLAYTISNLKDVDNREKELYNKISSDLNLTISKEELTDLAKTRFLILDKNKKVKSKLEKVLNIRRGGYKEDIDAAKDLHKEFNYYTELLKDKEENLTEKNKIDVLRKKYSGNFEKFVDFLNTNETVLSKVDALKQSNPEKVEEITTSIDDLNRLDDRRQDFIKTYNNLYTKEGQQKFKQDIDGFKQYMLADLPEDLTKHSATLTYYKAIGQSVKNELEKNNNQSTENTANQQQLERAAQMERANTAQQAVQMQQQTQPVELLPDELANQSFDTGQEVPETPVLSPSEETSTSNSINIPQENLNSSESEFSQDEIDSQQANQLFSMLRSFTSGDKSIASGFDNDFEKNIEFQKQAAPLLKSIIEQIENKNPTISRKNISLKVLNFMHDKMSIGEEQYNLLKSALNSIVGRNKDEDSINLSYSEFSNLKQDIKAVQTFDLADQINSTNDLTKAKQGIVKAVNESVSYGHEKNVIPHLSLAYLSHNYEENTGQIQTTTANENGKKLLSLKEFNTPNQILGTLSLDSSNSFQSTPSLLDYPVKIELLDLKTGSRVNTYLHVPKWIVDIKDSSGNSIITDDLLNHLTNLALENNIGRLVVELNKLSGNDIERFRNVGVGKEGSTKDIAYMFSELVKFRDALQKSPVQDREIKISDISNGKISFMNSFENATDFLPDPNIRFAIVDQNKQLKTNKNTVVETTYQNNNLKPGEVVTILKLKNNRTIPVNVRLKNTTKEQQDIFIASVKDFLSNTPQSIKIKSSVLNLGKVNSLKKFLSIYVSFIPNMSSYNFVDPETNKINYELSGKVLIDFSDATDSKPKAVQIMMSRRIKDKDGKNGTLYVRNESDLQMTVAELIKKQGLTYDFSQMDATKTFDKTTVEQLLRDTMKNKLSTIETDVSGEQLLESDNVKTNIPIVSVTDGKLDISNETISYTEHVKARVLTNVNGKNNIGTETQPEYSYLEQPVFVMNDFPRFETSNKIIGEKPKANTEENILKSQTWLKQLYEFFYTKSRSDDRFIVVSDNFEYVIIPTLQGFKIERNQEGNQLVYQGKSTLDMVNSNELNNLSVLFSKGVELKKEVFEPLEILNQEVDNPFNSLEDAETELLIDENKDIVDNPFIDDDFLFEDKLIISEQTKQNLKDKTDECK